MITRLKTIPFPHTYPLETLGKLDEILFFDIETTGFSPQYSTLYLIGCTYYREGDWHLVQWFADTLFSEVQVLSTFFDFLKDFRILLHFNGDGFDIPYLQKRCSFLGVDCDFSHVTSIDIYKKIKPYKKLLSLDSLKQKAIEAFLGISRKDLYSGGQLIEVYKDYLMTKEDFLYDLLILHNEDDLKGMPSILPILSYPDFFEGEFCLKDQSLITQTDLFGREDQTLRLIFSSPTKLPVPVDLEKDFARIECKEDKLYLDIQLFQGALKYYHPNHRDYYYLIYEDQAIHKSVAEYVDKAVKKKATADTCYTKKEGCFLPQCVPKWEPALRKDRKEKISYAEYSENMMSLSDTLEYLSHILCYTGILPDGKK